MKEKQYKRILILGVLCLLLGGICFFFRPMFTAVPFTNTYVFDGPSGVYPGASGRLYVIDAGKKSVLITDGDGNLIRSITAGADNDVKPYYASLVAEGADGSIYIADVRYAGQGTLIRQERIFRYDADGGNGSLLYTIDYEQEDRKAPLQYGNILSLREEEGELVFTIKTETGLAVCQMDLETGELQSTTYDLPGQYISDADAEPGTLRPIFTNRLGQVCTVTEGAVEVLLDEGRTSWMLCAEEGQIYYTDLATNTVLRYELESGFEEVVLEAPDIIYAVQTAGGRLYATDYMGYYRLTDGEAEYVDTLAYTEPVLRYVLWGALFLAGVLLLAVLFLLFAPALRKPKSALFQRMAIVLGVSLCMGGLVGYITINQMIVNQNASVMEQLNLFADILVETTDLEAFQRIDSIDDYRNEDYSQVKEPLDGLADMTYVNDLNYYYILYAADETTIYVVMDYEDSSVAKHPVYAWGTEGYTDVFVDGEPIEVSSDVSSYGSWSFVLKPVFDEEGQVAAVMEVGVNLDQQVQENRDLVINVVFTVLSTTLVLLMVIIETIFYAEHRERKMSLPESELIPSRRFPLRTMAFLLFLADCMQDPFVSILANRLYTPILGIPQSVGAALPLSAQVLCAALSAFACGSIIRKTGAKRMLTIGFIIQMAGFVLCGALMQYMGLLIGKMVIGIGIGALLVSLNSIAAAGRNENETAEAFTAVNAGTLAGITVGAGVGALLMYVSDFSMVYYVSALILVIGLLMSVFGEDYRLPQAPRQRQRQRHGLEVFQFIGQRKVWSFLLLLLMPFLCAISYREYFFPLYAAEMGITESDIGRIYLICGLLVIYMGPFFTRVLVGRLGGKGTAVLASCLMIVATLLFAVVPTVTAAVLGILLLSIAISFGYAAQSTYYSSLTQVQTYGESRAMGVYSLFDNGGQTLGPVLYGVALLAGYRQGIMIVGILILALLALFLLANVRTKGEKMQAQKESVKGE